MLPLDPSPSPICTVEKISTPGTNLSGWDRPHFNDAAWSRAGSIEAPAADHLVSDTSPPIRERETLHAVRITEPKPGIFVYDLGRNFAGWPSIAVTGPAGASIKLTPGELLDNSGLVTQRSEGGGPTYFSYTLRGSGTEHWEPRFSYYGFRYVQVEGAAPPSFHRASLPVLQNLEGKFIYLDVEQTGHFSSSNNTLNQIHALILEALKSNLQHVLTDCPHREKLGWLEVSYLMAPSMLYDYDLRNFFPKVIADIRDSQTVRRPHSRHRARVRRVLLRLSRFPRMGQRGYHLALAAVAMVRQ